MVKLNTKDEGVLSEDEHDQKVTEESEMRAEQQRNKEAKIIARKLKKKHQQEIADETGKELSTIESLSKRLIDDPTSIIKKLVDDTNEKRIEEQNQRINNLEEWFTEESLENVRLKSENEKLRGTLETIQASLVKAEISTLTKNLGEWTTEENLTH